MTGEDRDGAWIDTNDYGSEAGPQPLSQSLYFFANNHDSSVAMRVSSDRIAPAGISNGLR